MSKMEKTLYFVLIFLIIFFLFLDLWSKANAHENSIKINSMLNPVVQVKVDGGRGSGTIFKVRGKFSYVVTNFHVVARALWLSESPDKQGYTFGGTAAARRSSNTRGSISMWGCFPT